MVAADEAPAKETAPAKSAATHVFFYNIEIHF
jgi:hypothetical protein